MALENELEELREISKQAHHINLVSRKDVHKTNHRVSKIQLKI
jgi:hypothetical protein